MISKRSPSPSYFLPSALSDYGARFTKGPIENFGVSTTRLLLQNSLAAPLLIQMHSDSFFEGCWNWQRRTAMNWHGCIEAFLERLKGLNIDPWLQSHHDG